MAVDGEYKLYRCPDCGHVDHDEQDGTGHVEQGVSSRWEENDADQYSYWLLACSKCGHINNMREAKEE